ncbi:unnamed protein product [marine sediment metagenome]|uniref:Uncharacterized protein n=1 Tax=marine sediment metagenome TaxID=412755 RepID=X1JWV1_9ZZZZ
MRDAYSRAQIDLLDVRIRALEAKVNELKRRLDNPQLGKYLTGVPT